MNKLTVLLFLVISSTTIYSQDPVKIIVNEDIPGYEDKSYYYTESVTLTPGFTFTATSGNSFFIKEYGSTENVPPSQNKNFLRTESIKVAGQKDLNSVSGLDISSKTVKYSYLDGLGRSDQHITVKGTTSSKDLITFNKYDNSGRQRYSYLSYAIDSGNGQYRDNSETEQSNFYNTEQLVANDSRPYSETVYDNSPANRVLKSYGPGEDWVAGTNDYHTSYSYHLNDANEIKKWQFSGGILQSVSGGYPANQLTVETITSEGGQVSKVYTDSKGLEICTKVKESSTEWIEIYYLHNDFGDVTMVIPPSLAAINSPTSNDVDELAYQYVYDNQQRIISKKVPGIDWEYYVYDKWDRLVLTQDGVQRSKSTKEWTFFKYDRFNREIYTGIFKSNKSHSSLISDATTLNSDNRFETMTNSEVGYTLTSSFPTSIVASDVLEVTYNDNYSFLNNTNWDVENLDFQYSNGNQNVLEHVTGGKKRVIGSNKWLNSVIYYDGDYQPLCLIEEHILDGVTKTVHTYDFLGRIIETEFTHSSSAESSIVVIQEYVFNENNGSLSQVFQTIDGERIELSNLKYNELGQSIEVNVHGIGNNQYLQSIDKRYNIQGELISINNSDFANDGITNDDTNDLFGQELIYNQSEYAIGNNSSSKNYDGNISAIKWQSRNMVDPSKQQIMGFEYDLSDRLKNSNYAIDQNGSWNDQVGLYDVSIGSYDKNGNILTLTRQGSYGGVKTEIDDLTYSYANNNRSNRLVQIEDNGNEAGFNNNSVTIPNGEYVYDENGNVIEDLNRKIVSIKYNHLNLPQEIELENNSKITYLYDSDGSKLSMSYFEPSGQLVYSRYYTGFSEYVEESGSTNLDFIYTSDGRALKVGNKFEYEHYLKDHLGNIRVAYGDLSDVEVFRASMEDQNSLIEENDFLNISETRIQNTSINTTESTLLVPNPSHVSLLIGEVGPAKMLTVSSGDHIEMKVNASYSSNTGSKTSVIGSMAGLIANAFGYSSTGETSVIFQEFQNHAPVAGAMSFQNDNVPRAYIAYILFDENYSNEIYGWAEIPYEAYNNMTSLKLEISVPYNGYLYTYLGNESITTSSNAYFDDFQVTHTHTTSSLKVSQLSDYYPFGGTFYSYNTVTNNNYKFNGNEEQPETGLYDFKARLYDPFTARFLNVDPLADISEQLGYSPYQFGWNNPINLNDPNGDCPCPTSTTGTKSAITNWFSEAGDALYGLFIEPIVYTRQKEAERRAIFGTDRKELGREHTGNFILEVPFHLLGGDIFVNAFNGDQRAMETLLLEGIAGLGTSRSRFGDEMLEVTGRTSRRMMRSTRKSIRSYSGRVYRKRASIKGTGTISNPRQIATRKARTKYDPNHGKKTVSKRLQYLGKTPSKYSKTGLAVQAQMLAEKRLKKVGNVTYFKAYDNEWYNISKADMAHKTDAVTWWNKTARHKYAPKSKEVREWMRDPKNYYLELFSKNRSDGAKLKQRYLPPLMWE